MIFNFVEEILHTSLMLFKSIFYWFTVIC